MQKINFWKITFEEKNLKDLQSKGSISKYFMKIGILEKGLKFRIFQHT